MLQVRKVLTLIVVSMVVFTDVRGADPEEPERLFRLVELGDRTLTFARLQQQFEALGVMVFDKQIGCIPIRRCHQDFRANFSQPDVIVGRMSASGATGVLNDDAATISVDSLQITASFRADATPKQILRTAMRILDAEKHLFPAGATPEEMLRFATVYQLDSEFEKHRRLRLNVAERLDSGVILPRGLIFTIALEKRNAETKDSSPPKWNSARITIGRPTN